MDIVRPNISMVTRHSPESQLADSLLAGADSWPLENESDFYELADKNLDTS